MINEFVNLRRKLMNKISILLRILTVLGFLQVFVLVSVAQEKTENSVLTNESVTELVKSGISESIILAKIKNSNTKFDTSSTALVKLKEGGVSENIILAMIESKPRINTSTESEILLEMKDAVGKRKVLVESEDEKSQLLIIKTLKKNGFEVVVNEQDAELIIKFDFQTRTATIGVSPGIFGGVSMSQNSEQKNGKLKVFIRSGSNEQMIFVKERQPSSIGKYIHKQAEDYTEDFIKELKKAETASNSSKK
jgi:hypothetical protein